jgi:hypothetical protein
LLCTFQVLLPRLLNMCDAAARYEGNPGIDCTASSPQVSSSFIGLFVLFRFTLYYTPLGLFPWCHRAFFHTRGAGTARGHESVFEADGDHVQTRSGELQAAHQQDGQVCVLAPRVLFPPRFLVVLFVAERCRVLMLCVPCSIKDKEQKAAGTFFFWDD